MLRVLCYLSVCALLFVSCNRQTSLFQDAVAAWPFSDVNDHAGFNSQLLQQGTVKFLNLTDDEKRSSIESGSDGKAVYLNGSSWLDAGQGINDELNITGKGITLFVRMKPDSIKEYNPLLTKSGNDQTIAYSVALHKRGQDVYIETMLGSDDIGGAHLLQYKVPQDELIKWHNILFRFNGKISELYVDGILRDNEVTVGDARDWNNHPVLIGAQYKDPYVHGDSAKNTIEAAFKGWIDNVAIWNRCLEDDRVASLSGVAALKKDGLPEYYNEKYRPQFHFTAKKNWLNDPNGLVYYDGTYHLFFQYMPPHRHGAYKDWGHATSKDLVHWTQNEKHITPHKVWGGCWSGSAVVDVNNVSGFQSGKEKPVIAFITNGGSPNDGFGPKCTQCIAYSTDGGNTFTYYDQNPVIKNINGANRDPKVVWDEDSKKWIMSLYMDRGYEFGLFSSSNLRDWEQLSTVSLDRIAECPGFEPFPLDGNKNNKKWVFSGANGNYVIGTFNGKEFKPETGTIVGDYGNNLYAPQIWNNTPDDRKIQIAWLSTNRYPDMPFEQQMNFPTELELRTTHEGIRLLRMPVREIKKLYDSGIKWQRSVTPQGDNPLRELKDDLYDIDMEIDLKKSTSFDFSIRGATIQYDAAKKILRCGGAAEQSGFPPDNWKAYIRKKPNQLNNMGEAPLVPVNGKIKLRVLVDRTTLEIYANDGLVVMTSCFMPDETKFYALTADGEIDVNATIHSLKSAWTVNQE
ncbi:MAG: GH32 C-terminal domain-containing protein [Chitinophagaceae bacterium]|nr:GH32 C-terminal domain-containing protein [Chitinophagaceae bacterium]